MIDLDRCKEKFKNHKAVFSDYGNIKILDFKNPDSSDYRIRFLFEEDYYRLHISGDLGELVASNYRNMCYESFSDFIHDIYYFEEKIDCHSRKIYVYNEDKASEDIKEYLNEYGYLEDVLNSDKYCGDSDEEKLQDFIDEVLYDFTDETGVGTKGYEELSSIIDDAWEMASDLGKERTGILELYMLAFDLAQKQLKEADLTKPNKESGLPKEGDGNEKG